MFGGVIYRFLYCIVRAAMFIYHPIFRVYGRENVPKEGRLLICCNHSGLADPIWIIFALGLGHVPRIMAKKEALEVPVLGWFLRTIGVFGIDRDGVDISGMKTGIKCLRDEQQLVVFPEGTRVRPGRRVAPKRGALLLAARTDTPVLPMYLSRRRHPFGPLTCIIGKPYRLEFAGKRPTEAELEQASETLLDEIYRMGESK